MIDRRNILELIGRNRKKYHSCILTAYSFDFSFFEEMVLPVLRTANIKNVNVFVDGKSLEKAQAATTGYEFRHNKTYNFLPVYTTGVFHPKIMLLVGKTHGLLIIGSGNLTSSGLSTNDEIWGAFHLDNIKNDNATLFSAAWNYLQQFTDGSLGFVNQKIVWFKQYAPWLSELPEPTHETYIKSLNQHIYFVANNDNESILAQMKDIVPDKGVARLTVVSPYYDKKGEIINELYDHYSPSAFDCIIDTNYGSLPEDLDEELFAKISFYQWSECSKAFHDENCRLHAKMFHFRMADGYEYMMLGSANATNKGMGTSAQKAKNHEAKIILKRKSKSGTWLEDLQIKLPQETVSKKSFRNNGSLPSQGATNSKHQIKILYSEQRGEEISIYTKSQLTDSDVKLSIFSRMNTVIDTVSFEINGKQLVATCRIPDVFKVVLVNEKSEPVSNYSIVHKFEDLLRGNPDPKQEKLDELMDEDNPDREIITELLEYVDYNWADEGSPALKSFGSGGGSSTIPISVNQKKDYITLSEEEFNKYSDEAIMKQSGELSNPSVKIVEFLGVTGSNLTKEHHDDYHESEEQKLLEDEDQRGEGESVESRKKKKTDALKKQKAIFRYFKKLDTQYNSLLRSFYDKRELFEAPKRPINIQAFSNILIAIHLIQRNHWEIIDIEDGNDQRQERFLPDGTIFDDHRTIKGFLVNVLGKFLLLSTAGVKEYEHDILRQKLKSYQHQLLEKTIFTMLQLTWRENELKYRNNILLNALFFLASEAGDELAFLEELKERLQKHFSEEIAKKKVESKPEDKSGPIMATEAKSRSFIFNLNFQSTFNVLVPDYLRFLEKFTAAETLRPQLVHKVKTISNGTIIFSSRIGFNTIISNNRNDKSPKLSLARCGYQYSEEKKHYMWSDVSFVKKCIVYE